MLATFKATMNRIKKQLGKQRLNMNLPGIFVMSVTLKEEAERWLRELGRSGLDSQHLHDCSQHPRASDDLFWLPQALHDTVQLKYRQNTHTNKIIKI